VRVTRISRAGGKKSPCYYVDYTVMGRRRRVRVGPNKKQAEDVLAEIRSRLARGELGDLLPETKRAARKTFEQFRKDYEAKTEIVYRASSRDRNKSRYKVLDTFFGKYRLDQIDTDLVERFRNQRVKKDASPATVNRDFALLRRMLHVAVDWGDLPRRPDLRVRALREAPHDLVPPTVEQIDKLLSKCKGDLHDLVLLALYTGMRKGELFHLLWKDVDLKGDRIHVVSRAEHMTKANRSRMIPMHPMAKAMLEKRKHRKPDELVFPGRKGKPLNNIQTSWETARELAELPHLRFHDLRHTFASHLAMHGEPIGLIQALLGHRDLTTTQRYSHMLPGLDRAAVDRLDFGGKVSEPAPCYGRRLRVLAGRSAGSRARARTGVTRTASRVGPRYTLDTLGVPALLGVEEADSPNPALTGS
jgi:integrase